jgi:hypothetical protein
VAPPQCTPLPSLESLEYDGPREYIEDLVARIDPPALCQINIRISQDISFELPQFCRFVPLLSALRSSTCAHVIHFKDYVRVSFFEEGRPSESYERYSFETSGGELYQQLAFSAEIARHHSPLLSSVRKLDGECDRRLPVKEVQEDENIDAEVLPELTTLRLDGYPMPFLTVSR